MLGCAARAFEPSQNAPKRRKNWLEGNGFPAASNPVMWKAICANWISFLSATSTRPKAELAPCRKVVTWEPRGSESPEAQTQRLEYLAERWPVLIRKIVNQEGQQTEAGPFESRAAKVNLTKRQRGNSVLLRLVCFLVYSYDEGTLEEMGLELSKGLQDSIIDIMQAEVYFGPINQSIEQEPGPVEAAVANLVRELITDSHATFQTNLLLCRGQFTFNILTMDMDIEEQLEVILHYSKVFVLDYAMQTWERSEDWLDEVQSSLAEVNLDWLHADSDQQPAMGTDRRRWGQGKTVIKVIRELLQAQGETRPTMESSTPSHHTATLPKC
ncbi:hypothetical protein B7463_g12406, partial [Scytalidium lignicola]